MSAHKEAEPLTGRVVERATVLPDGALSVLSQVEVHRLCTTYHSSLHRLFRRCALAVLVGAPAIDDEREILRMFANFDLRIAQDDRGIRLELENAPAQAFVDGRMIRGVAQQLFAVLRDLTFFSVAEEALDTDLSTPQGVTDLVFKILRNAGLLRPALGAASAARGADSGVGVAVCWGGHAICREEYEYTKEVGYELGLRGVEICTGCGPGAMKGPMKGATIGHAKQRLAPARHIGITEPGIIASESPNPIVNELVVMPDIEKRLEAFVRIGHAVVVFPGGVGTAEEMLFLLGVLAHPDNASLPFPIVLTGPESALRYFSQFDKFIRRTLGDAFAERYRVLVDEPEKVACVVREGIEEVLCFRDQNDDADYFNWGLRVPRMFQEHFEPTHANMRALNLDPDRPPHELACDLRRAFSGIVAGNVKQVGIERVEQHGPFELRGDPVIVRALDELLADFAHDNRMRLGDRSYTPCYRLVG